MAKSVRLISAVLILAAIAATPAEAQRTFNRESIFGSVPLGCALDYTNRNETRAILTNTSGQSIAAGSTISWSTDDARRSFKLPRALAAGALFSFPLNTKSATCTARATPPLPMLSPN